MPDTPAHIARFSEAPSMADLPQVVDVRTDAPPNPPEEIQVKFVGASYVDAYTEANSFVTVADEFAAKHTGRGLAGADRILDFGSGWGRITRTVLTRVSDPTRVYAADVDPQMTALLGQTLSGVNALTVDAMPPTALGDATMDVGLAFSVFSHLSGPAHEAWAKELGRLIKPGGIMVFTVLDEAFFGQVGGAQAAVAAGEADGFAASLAQVFPDLEAARRGFDAGDIQYTGVGGGEMRTGETYGWAAAPMSYVTRTWAQGGFHLVEWVRSGVLFPQALVVLQRTDSPVLLGSAHLQMVRARATVRSRLRQIRSRFQR